MFIQGKSFTCIPLAKEYVKSSIRNRHFEGKTMDYFLRKNALMSSFVGSVEV